MTAVTTPALRSATGGSGSRAVTLAKKVGTRALAILAPARPVAKNFASYPLTVAMAVCVDIGGFTLWHRAGWFVLAASLGYLEHVLADE